MNKLHLSHLIRKPTLDNNTQDIVLASDAESINAGEVGEVLANSEHKIVRCEINCEVDTKENALLVASYIKKVTYWPLNQNYKKQLAIRVCK